MRPWWFFAMAIAAAALASLDMARDAGAPGLPEDEPAQQSGAD